MSCVCSGSYLNCFKHYTRTIGLLLLLCTKTNTAVAKTPKSTCPRLMFPFYRVSILCFKRHARTIGLLLLLLYTKTNTAAAKTTKSTCPRLMFKFLQGCWLSPFCLAWSARWVTNSINRALCVIAPPQQKQNIAAKNLPLEQMRGQIIFTQ